MTTRRRPINKVLLIKPPFLRLQGDSFYYAPLGLCYLAGVLEQAKYDVLVYNADFDLRGGGVSTHTVHSGVYKRYLDTLLNLNDPLWLEIEKVIRDVSPDLVGITVWSPFYNSALNVAKLVKRLDPSITTVFGGPHATAVPQTCLEMDEVDYVVRGEGEISFLELIKHLDRGEGQIQSIEGISYKQDGQCVDNPERPFIADLDSIPFPAKHLLVDLDKYPSSGLGPIFTCRGCPFHCIFCASHVTWTRKVRYRSARNVVDEIKELKKRYGVYKFRFEDDIFNIKKAHVTSICDLLVKEKVNINFWCESRADLMDDEQAQKLKQAGCVAVSIGVESGVDAVLEQIEKAVTADDIRRTYAILKKHKIEAHAFFQMGFPFETPEQVRETVAFMKEIDPDQAEISVATPLPGTKLYNMAVTDHLVPEKPEWDKFFYGGLEKLLNKNITVNELDNLIDEVQTVFRDHNLRRRKRYFLKPDYIFRRVFKERFWQNPRILYAYFREMFIQQ